jgi:hypothetical protein
MYWPLGQATHAVAPVPGCTYPASQAEQAVMPVMLAEWP